MIPTRTSVRSAALAALLLSAACGEAPAPPPPEFHAGRAWSHLGQQIAFGPRYPGDRGAERQTRWLVKELRFRADTVVRQTFTFTGEQGKRLEGVNVVARFRPELTERVLLVAHRDTRRRADGSPDPLDRKLPVPGANVNASGVALLMELAELFRQQPPPVGVDLLFPDADEYSAAARMAGTRHFLQQMPGYRPRYALVLQAVAGTDPLFVQDEGSLRDAAEPTRRLWETAARLGYDSLFVAETAPPMENQAAVLAEAGIPTVVLADREYGPGNTFWQSYGDTMEHVEQSTLEAVGRTVAAFVYAEPAPEEEES